MTTRIDRRRQKLIREVEDLAANVKDQAQLDAILLKYPNLALRTALFHILKPYLTFPNPQLPTTAITKAEDVN